MRVALHVGLPLTNRAGTASWSIPVPNLASLRGLSFFLQSAIADQGANSMGLALSNAIQVTIGSK